MNKASPLDTMCSNKRPSLFPYWHLIVLSTLIKTLLYTEFLIKYYGYSFDYLITITNQFTINTHTQCTITVCSLPDTDLQNPAKQLTPTPPLDNSDRSLVIPVEKY